MSGALIAPQGHCVLSMRRPVCVKQDHCLPFSRIRNREARAGCDRAIDCVGSEVAKELNRAAVHRPTDRPGLAVHAPMSQNGKMLARLNDSPVYRRDFAPRGDGCQAGVPSSHWLSVNCSTPEPS